MHQTKSLGIISPVFSFMMCDVSSLVISLKERLLITFSLNPRYNSRYLLGSA